MNEESGAGYRLKDIQIGKCSRGQAGQIEATKTRVAKKADAQAYCISSGVILLFLENKN